MLGMTADSGSSPKQQYVVETAHTCSAGPPMVAQRHTDMLEQQRPTCREHAATRINMRDSESLTMGRGGGFG